MLKIKYFSLYLSAFLLLFLFTLAVSAKDNWIRVNSKNFHLIGNASENEIRKVATKLEQFRETFRRLFNKANFDSPIPTNVVVFKSASSYKFFKPRRADGKINENIAGYFQPGRDVNYITLSTEGEDADTFGTIFHEYVHFMLDINFGKSEIPPWFNEGLAEYYQTFVIEKDQEVKLGLPQDGHLMFLQENKLIPLNTFFNISNYALHQNGNHSRSVFYAQSWALIHYLLQNSKGLKQGSLDKFISAVIKDVPPEKAFQETFQMTYAEMEKELKNYISRRSYQYQWVKFNQKLVFDTEMKVTPLPESEANAYLGELLYRLRQYDDADSYLKKSIAADPNSSLANTTLGMVKFHQRKFDEAKQYLEKAISGDHKNHFAYYNYAYLISRENRDEFGYVSSFPADKAAKMRDALKKSIAINPAYTESYELLAFVNMVNNESLDESFELLKKALTYKPGDQQIILRIAEILSRQEKFADARFLAEKMSKVTDDPEIKSRADNLLSRIQTIESVNAQNEAARKQYEEQRKQYEAQRNEASKNGNSSGLTRRTREREKTPEEIAKASEEAQIISINQALKKPAADEKQIFGKIIKVACIPKTVVYTVKTDSGTVTLYSKDFQNLALVDFGSGVENVPLGCNANMTAFNAVLTYKNVAKAPYAGELFAIDFVPANFRLMTENDIAEIEKSRQIISGSPSSQNNETVVFGDKPEDVAASRSEAMMQAMKRAMRQLQAGEIRVMGTIEKIECDKDGQYFVMKTNTELLKLKAFGGIQMKAFVPDISQIQFGCGMKSLDVNAVTTYKPNNDKKSKVHGDLISLEFVPKSFTLE